VFLIILVMALAVTVPSDKRDPEEEETSSVHQTIPDPNGTETPESKSEGYRRSGDIGDYWDSLERDEEEGDLSGGGRSEGAPVVQTVDELFGPDGKDVPKPPARERKTQAASSAKEKAADAEPAPAGTGSTEPTRTEKPQVKRSSAVSSLDEDVARSLGNGFSSLDTGDSYVSSDEGHPYKCMFTRSEKIRDGQRISVRLLEDIIIGGVLIPQNTHLSAVCTMSGRMNVTVTSLEIRGSILKFKLEGYDTDGAKGIYCSDLGDTRKKVTEQGIATATSSLNSKLGKAANDAVELGASIIRSRTGEVTVEIPAGYVFYVIESKEK